MDLFSSVVGGLAIVAHENSGVKSLFVARYSKPDVLVGNVHAGSGKPYEVYEMRIGSKCYLDRPTTITRIPFALSGLPAIRPAQLDKYSETNDFLSFQLRELSRVYIMYEAATKNIPQWLRAFSVERLQVEVDQDGTLRFFQVYSKDFHPGTVVLGGNYALGSDKKVYMNYFVALSPLYDTR
jgi:hypothetical protein